MSSPTAITELLRAWNNGDESALGSLIPIVEKQLRRLAAQQMKGERPDHTLQTTGLVNEAYLVLARQGGLGWQDRAHFYAVAAQVMRRVLLDYAKARHRLKRGGAVSQREASGELTLEGLDIEAIIELDDALTRLAQFDAVKGRVVELRHFGGLSVEETAEVMGLAPVTIMRHWRLAKAWLQKELRNQSQTAGFRTVSSGS